MSKKTPTVFLRDATGLTREIGYLESIAMNATALPLISIAITPWYIWVGLGGAGDPILATALAFIPTFFTILCFAMTTATFPRSGAPYVAQSRVLHPAIGWPSEVLQWFGTLIISLGLMPSLLLFFAVAPGLYAMGVSSGNQTLINIAFAVIDPTYSAVIGTILLGILFLITIRGTKFLATWINLPLVVIQVVAIVAMVAVLAGGTHQQLVNLSTKYLTQDYNTILSTATQSYPSLMVPVGLTAIPILYALGFTGGAVNTYWNAWAAGEVKRAGVLKMQIGSMVIPSIITALASIVVLALAYNVAGRAFLVAITQLFTYNAGFFKAPFFSALSAVTFIPMMLSDNFYLQLLMMVGCMSAVLAYVPYTILLSTRDLFAWSFDRLVPAKFSEVSERWHTPAFNIVITFLVGWVTLMVFTYFSSYVLYFFATGWDTSLTEITIVCLAAMLLPLRKTLWADSPARKYVIAGIPLISIAGIIGVLYNGWGIVVFSTNAAMGFGVQSQILTALVFIIPFALYWVIRAIRKSQGIDLDLIFRSVPPE